MLHKYLASFFFLSRKLKRNFTSGYDDEPDVDVGDTDVGADFGDFGF